MMNRPQTGRGAPEPEQNGNQPPQQPEQVVPNNISVMPQRRRSGFGSWMLWVGLALAITAAMAFILSEVDMEPERPVRRSTPRRRSRPRYERRPQEDDDEDEDEDEDDDEEETPARRPKRRKSSTQHTSTPPPSGSSGGGQE